MVNLNKNVKILHYNDSVDIVYEACTACYDNTKPLSFQEKKEYIGKRVKAGHSSVLEHGYVSFIIHDIKKSKILLEALSEYMRHSHYLHVYTTQNEDNTWNILIGGSIRAFNSLIEGFVKESNDHWADFDNFMLEYTLDVLYLTTVKEFYTNLPENNIVDPRKFIDLPFNINDTTDINNRWGKEDRELGNVKIIDTRYNLLNICDIAMRYGFITSEVLNIIPVTVLFSNMSRTATHQLVRHRNAITQESQRYVSSENAKFTIPDMSSYIEDYEDKKFDITLNGVTSSKTLDELSKDLLGIYKQLQDQGVKKEDARAFLPSNVQCKRLYMTFTVNSLVKFLELRTDKHAQTEIRKYATDLRSLYINLDIVS